MSRSILFMPVLATARPTSVNLNPLLAAIFNFALLDCTSSSREIDSNGATLLGKRENGRKVHNSTQLFLQLGLLQMA